MDVFRFPLVLGLVISGRITHRNNTIGPDIVRKDKRLDCRRHPVFIRIARSPHGSQSKGLGGQDLLIPQHEYEQAQAEEAKAEADSRKEAK